MTEPGLPSDLEGKIERLVRASLDRASERVDPRPLFERIAAEALGQSPGPDRRRKPRISWRWSGLAAAAALLAVCFPLIRQDRKALAKGEAVVREARRAHLQPIDRCYLVEVRRESSLAAEIAPNLPQVRQTRLWTRGDRFWVESIRPDQRWAWGRDEAEPVLGRLRPALGRAVRGRRGPRLAQPLLRPPLPEPRALARRRARPVRPDLRGRRRRRGRLDHPDQGEGPRRRADRPRRAVGRARGRRGDPGHPPAGRPPGLEPASPWPRSPTAWPRPTPSTRPTTRSRGTCPTPSRSSPETTTPSAARSSWPAGSATVRSAGCGPPDRRSVPDRMTRRLSTIARDGRRDRPRGTMTVESRAVDGRDAWAYSPRRLML